MQTLTVDFHPSVQSDRLRQAAIDSLAENRIEPKLLYATPGQAELWRRVFLKHSPIHGNPEFVRMFDQAFDRVTGRTPGKKIHLVGLGCGTGLKEAELCSRYKARGLDVLFSAVDVSADLVLESARRLVEGGAMHRRSLVCDLHQTEFLAEWLNGQSESLRRVITFFGLSPNFVPEEMVRIIRAVLRPDDMLLISAHLAPAQGESATDLAEAMKSVLPQYDNPETHAWLEAALDFCDLRTRVDPPEIKADELGGIPAFIATARWKTGEPFERWGHRFSPNMEEPLRLFFSLRYTPSLFEKVLRSAGFSAKRLAITACLQEAVWCIRND